MKILFFSHYFPPEVNAPATRTYEHCVRWVRAGHDVTVVTCAPNCPNGVVYPGYKNGVRRQIEDVDGIRVVRVWTYMAPNAGTVRRVLNYVSFLATATLASLRLSRPDVIVATSPQLFCGWAGVLASWLKRVPLVLEIRDIWPESIEAVGALRNRLLLRLLERMERRMYRSARHIVAVGRGYRDNIVSKVGLGDRISVITNGVDLEFFKPAEPDVRFLHMWDLEDRFVCSYIGTIGMAHGLEVVLDAAKILKQKKRRDICFALVGDGASRQRLREQAKQADLTDMVVFVDRQPKEEIPPILASSDACLIHLKKCELFGTVLPSKIFETMAMERPIIIGVRGEARDIVVEAGAGLEMEPDSASSLVEAIKTLADDPGFAAQHGRAARTYVAKHYNRDLLAAEYLDLLHRVAGVADSEAPAGATPPPSVEQPIEAKAVLPKAEPEAVAETEEG
ncbi:MAG: glycosyltransferase family 4 protein [Pirellulales bacterium]|nr:glycosyltransferase family 4 protein [Pirellulales bacterium]